LLYNYTTPLLPTTAVVKEVVEADHLEPVAFARAAAVIESRRVKVFALAVAVRL
jgi:hypothetical protein